jgi:hypothetical protein
MKAVVTVAECVQGLGRFLELIPPRTIASTDDHATAYVKRPHAQAVELQDTTRRIDMVLDILRGGNVTAMLLEEVVPSVPLQVPCCLASLTSFHKGAFAASRTRQGRVA